MSDNLYYNTVTPYLLKVLKHLMLVKEFEKFRLVGGTALSLIRGHRFSVDIDLFTDAEYGSLSFDAIDNFLKANYSYVDSNNIGVVGFGKSYFVGKSKEVAVKLDVYYTDKFVSPLIEIEKIRLASVEEIIAMKLDVINRGGRKKDFWDIHELIGDYSFTKMLDLHKKRYPYAHNAKQIKKEFSNFELADEEPDPVCMKGKFWEIIKLDVIDFSKSKL